MSLSYLRLSTICYNCINDSFHYLSMIARMYTCLFNPRMWMTLHRHSLLSIICCYVLEDFSLRKWLTFFVVSSEPETRCLSVEIVGYWEVILSVFSYDVLIILRHFFFFLFFRLGKSVVIIHIIKIKSITITCLFFFLTFVCNHLDLSMIAHVINIHYFFVFVSTLVRIWSFDPTVSSVFFKLIGIELMEPLQILNSLFTRDTFSYQILLILW